MHFDEIPTNELETILCRRCEIPLSYAKKVVLVMKDLQSTRKGSAAFAGKHGFITLRDLFRWGERYRLANAPDNYNWNQHLVEEGKNNSKQVFRLTTQSYLDICFFRFFSFSFQST